MRINVNSEVQSASGFPLWAPGKYGLRVKELESTTASTGKAQLKVRLEPVAEVLGEEGGPLSTPGTLVDYITVDPIQSKSGGMFSFLRAFVESAGLSWADFDTDELIGREVTAVVAIEPDNKGTNRNRVKRYVKAA